MDLYRIFAVIVNWNLKDDTIACIRSVQNAGLPPENIILVDNGSVDNSVSAIRKVFSSIIIIKNMENLGFAGANNIGIDHALTKQAEWVFLLNNDTVVSPTFFADIQCVHKDVQARVYAPRINYFDEPGQVWYLGHVHIAGTLFSRTILKKNSDIENKIAVPIDFASGCGVLIHREIFETVGVFDPSFFMYGEDADLMWRIRQAGYSIFAVPKAVMWHKVSRSAGKDSPATRYWKTRNQIRFYRLHAFGAKKWLMFGLSTVRTIGFFFYDMFVGKRYLLLPLARGWFDGWLGTHYFSGEYEFGNRNL